jgi:Ca2+-binding EF-hand superfamily protein
MRINNESVIRDNFDLVDTDKDGFLSKSECGLLFRGLGQTISDSKLNQLLSAINHERISYAQFKQFYQTNYSDPISEERLIEAFKVFDPTGSGKISAARFRDITTSLGTSSGDCLTEPEIEEIFKLAGIDPKGIVDYRKFASLVTAPPKNLIG